MISDLFAMRFTRAAAFAAVLVLAATPGVVRAGHEAEHALGKVDFPVSCSDQAQQEFNLAVALLHHMTYPRAKATFAHVAELDPGCAMAHWGIAMTLFQPLWPTRPGPDELQEGWQAVQKAKALEPPTERERLYVASAEAFFRNPESADYWERIRRWESAMEAVYLRFPEDQDAAALYALALLATAPAGGSSLDHQNRAAEILLSVHAKNPDHPGSIHYLIHANDVRGREHDSLEIVRAYGEIAPRNAHALHMPTHIFTRLGQWGEVIQGNLKAADAALEQPAGDRGQYVWDEFPHAIEYLVYAYLQQGADQAAQQQLERLSSTKRLYPTFKTAFHLSSTPARWALERRAWEEAAALPPRPYDGLEWDRYPWPEAVTWFAKGLGAAHLNRPAEAERAIARLGELEQAADQAKEELFTRQIRILRFATSAWMAHAQGEEELALERMQAAVDLELSTPKHPVTPAPTLPSQELLGDLLLDQARPEQALTAYQRSLELYPNRFNSMLGAARAARTLKDEEAAGKYYRALVRISARDSGRAGLEEALTYISAEPTNAGAAGRPARTGSSG
jgi:tetratricopeptide (TPR) repeat protein